ncbi:hypothetical protein D3C87_1859200 [compost metagenome]
MDHGRKHQARDRLDIGNRVTAERRELSARQVLERVCGIDHVFGIALIHHFSALSLFSFLTRSECRSVGRFWARGGAQEQ